jgi:hypothetical protein
VALFFHDVPLEVVLGESFESLGLGRRLIPARPLFLRRVDALAHALQRTGRLPSRLARLDRRVAADRCGAVFARTKSRPGTFLSLKGSAEANPRPARGYAGSLRKM